jgi:hypothetical protein
MTWHHHLDSMESISDSNTLDRQGDLLVEAGSFRWAGLSIPFREEWRRISRLDDEVSVQVDTNRIQVTLGQRRIAVEDERPSGMFRATRQVFEEGAWQTHGTILEPARATNLTVRGATSLGVSPSCVGHPLGEAPSCW